MPQLLFCLAVLLFLTAQPRAAVAQKSPNTPVASASAGWSSYRGPNRDGIYKETPINTIWAQSGLPQVWKRKIGGGFASIVVGEGKVFTIEQKEGREATTAYQLSDGKPMWTAEWEGRYSSWMGGKGPRATPTYDAGHVSSLGALGELRCLDAKDGKVVWAKNILKDNSAENVSWGMAASPLVYRDLVIVLPGGRQGRSVVAYNKLTGARAWSALDDKQAYTAPMLATFGGVEQLLVVTGLRAVGLEPATGKLLWEFPWTTSWDVNSAQPLVAGENRFVLSAGYGHGSALVEVNRAGDSWSVKQLWQNKNLKNKFNSSVVYEGHVYGLDEGILTCVDLNDGARRWKGGRYGYGQLLLAEGHLVLISEEGEVYLIRATPEKHDERAHFAAINGKTWNVPAMAEGFLLVRNEQEMACFRIGKG